MIAASTPLKFQRQQQFCTFSRYKTTPLTDQTADHAILQLYRNGVINIQRVPDVMRQWEEPECDWGDKTAYRLFNATTFALNGRVAEAPQITSTLHRVIDGCCEAIN